MREIGISKDDISICLGHREPEHNLITTGIYINEDYRKADIANWLFIDELNKKEEKNENKIAIWTAGELPLFLCIALKYL